MFSTITLRGLRRCSWWLRQLLCHYCQCCATYVIHYSFLGYHTKWKDKVSAAPGESAIETFINADHDVYINIRLKAFLSVSPFQISFERPNVVKRWFEYFIYTGHRTIWSRVIFASTWVGLPGDGGEVHHSGDFIRELLMPTDALPIGSVDELGSDIHLGNFNQHLQWLQSPRRASVTLTYCCLFYITVSLLF